MWQVLGIEPTVDKKAIKRAYAKKLKITRPDEHPAAFQALHKAYKDALAQAALNIAAEHNTGSVDGDDQVALQPNIALLDELQTTALDDLNAKPVACSSNSNSISEETILMSDNPLQSIEPDAEPSSPDAAESEALYINAGSFFESGQARQDQVDANEDKHVVDIGIVESDEHSTELTADQQVFHSLLERVEILLDPMQDYQTVANWQFLTKTPLILEPDFNWVVGSETLNLIYAHNNKLARLGRPEHVVCPAVMRYIDGIFAWSENKAYLHEELDEEVYIALVEPLLEREQHLDVDSSAIHGLRGGAQVRRLYKNKELGDHYHIGGDFRRAIAFIIDFVILSFIAVVATELTFSFAPPAIISVLKNQDIWLLLGLSFGYFWLMEGPYWQASIGKRVLGLQVMNQDFEPVTWLRSFARTFIFFFSNFAFRIVLLINVFLKGRYVHDRITSTLVIDMRQFKQKRKQYE